MVYGKHGRGGIYDVQESLRLLSRSSSSSSSSSSPSTDTIDIRDPAVCLPLVRTILKSLPHRHRLSSTIATLSSDMWAEDSELYDVFCHSQDVAYDVQGVFDLVKEGGGGGGEEEEEGGERLVFQSWQVPRLYEAETYLGKGAMGEIEEALGRGGGGQ